MRILHFVDSGGFYGAEAVLLGLATEHLRLGHAASIVSIGNASSGEKALEREARRRGVPVHVVRMADGLNIRGGLRLAELARRESADIVHSHGYKPNILLGILPRRLRPAPMVATVHGYTHTSGFDRMRVYEWLDVHALRRFDRVVFVHSGMRTIPGLNRLDERRVRVIENGLPNQEQSGSSLHNPQLASFCTGHVIGAVGRLSSEKGFDRLIDAFSRVVAAGAQAKLVILGEGPERAALEERVRAQGLSERVLMPGFVDATAHLSLFTVFALSSLTEGLPISLLEAMRAGVPIVATRVGAIPSIVGADCGVLVDADDVAGLADALQRALNDVSFAATISKAAAAKVREYSVSRMAARYLTAYEELTACKVPSPYPMTAGL
jgi:glycosyltransferase involved in cell wall biosynthesis